MNRDNCIPGVVFAGKKRLGFQAVYELLQGADLALEVAVDMLALVRELEVSGDVAVAADQFRIRCDRILNALFLTHDLLRPLWIGPKIRVGSLLINFRQLLAQFVRVKGTPGGYGLYLSAQCTAVRVLQPLDSVFRWSVKRATSAPIEIIAHR